MGSTRKGMLNVPIAAVLWGSLEVCAQYIMEQNQMLPQSLTMTRLTFAGLTLLTPSFAHGDRIFPTVNNHKDAISLLILSMVGVLTVQLIFLLTIEKSNAAMATVLQFLPPTIIVAWFSLARKSRPGTLVFCAILALLVGASSLVAHGNPTSLSISPAVLFWGIVSAFAVVFHTTHPSTLVARYGTLPVVGWSMLIGGLILLSFYVRQGINFVVNGSLTLALFYLVVIGTSLTFSLYLKGVQLIGGPKVGTLSCAELLSSALLSLLLLGITFTLPNWLGTLLTLPSVTSISMDSRRRIRKVNRPVRHE